MILQDLFSLVSLFLNIRGSVSQINLSQLAEGKTATAMRHALLMKVAASTKGMTSWLRKQLLDHHDL